MAVDLRQVMAAFLTFSMFIMLGNMIKKDHIDPLLEPYPESANASYNTLKVSKAAMLKLTEIGDGLWRETEPIKPCWIKPTKNKQQYSNGYIFFSLTHGPEFHASQVANAVAVAQHLGAKLAIPDIKETKSGSKMHFGEIYDVERFITSLSGVVQVDKNPPSYGRLSIIRVPDRVSVNFIESKIIPIFRLKRNLKIVTNYNSSWSNPDKLSTAYQCMSMFETLKLQTELRELVDSMVGTLKSMTQKTRRRFIAVDLRVDMLKRKMCNTDRKCCYDAEEIGEFLSRVGFQKETVVYLTQTGWSSSLNGLRDEFPYTFTKDAIMAADQKAKFMDSEYEKFIDFYVCTEGDIFVPAFPSRFYSGVVGKRIGRGKTQILLPANNASINGAAAYVAPFIAKRTHFAFSCFC